MNLLTLQRCREDAEKMAADPYAWTGDFRMSPYVAGKIMDQGRRTLEVLSNVDRMRNKYESEVL